MFCCVFGSHLFFTNLRFFAIFFFLSAGFSCPLCFLVSIVLLASFLTDIPVQGGHSFSHLLPPSLSFFQCHRMYSDPCQGWMWLVLLAVVTVACLWCPVIGEVLGRRSWSCTDWGHLNLSITRVPAPQLIMMTRPCVCS